MATSTQSDPDRAGWPRPRADWRDGGSQRFGSIRCPELPDRLPVPWINGPCVRDHNDWHSFRPNALEWMKAGRLCLVCGEPVDGPVYLPAQNDVDDRVTSGGGGHARCVLLAIKCCPHLVERAYEDHDLVGWRWDRPGLGFLATEHDTHGDCDPVEPDAVAITLGELKAAIR